MAIVLIDGKRLPLDDDICKTDRGLRDALVTYYPLVENAKIKRETKGNELVITVTKQAGGKGLYGPIAEALDKAPEVINQILLLSATSARRLDKNQLNLALLEMLKQEQEMNAVIAALDQAQGRSANSIPTGF